MENWNNREEYGELKCVWTELKAKKEGLLFVLWQNCFVCWTGKRVFWCDMNITYVIDLSCRDSDWRSSPSWWRALQSVLVDQVQSPCRRVEHSSPHFHFDSSAKYWDFRLNCRHTSLALSRVWIVFRSCQQHNTHEDQPSRPCCGLKKWAQNSLLLI